MSIERLRKSESGLFVACLSARGRQEEINVLSILPRMTQVNNKELLH